MSRAKVVRLQCDRCKRTELMPEASAKVGADFDGTCMGQRLVFEDLCVKCKEAVMNLWVELKEWDRQVKYTVIKNGPLVDENKAAPMAPAPNYSPPQPHSAAAGKR